ALANLTQPFPGEVTNPGFLGVGVASPGNVALLKRWLGTNEPGWTDTFNPFTSANYVSSNLPALTAGTWTGTTDDGLSVASCTTGTGAAFLSKSGARANDA